MKKSEFLERMKIDFSGQSLVETALLLPVILFLLAGVLELSNLLVTQNRVSTAARIGTGFGATNYNGNEVLTDTFAAMSQVSLNNVTETLDLQPDRWDIYTVKATLNISGDAFTEWIWDRPYGTQEVFPESEWTANEAQIQNDILDALGESGDGLEIVATVGFHDRESFLGLNFFDIAPLTRIRGLTVMRISETRGRYGGCDTFPIALSLKNYSVYPSDYDKDNPPADMPWVAGGELYPLTEDKQYGGAQDIYWPDDPNEPWPERTKNPPTYTLNFNEHYPAHRPGIPLDRKTPRGTLFLVKQADPENTGNAGAFGWLRWNESSSSGSSTTLAESLTWPGDSDTYYHPWWSDDGQINIYDQVLVSTGSIVSSKDEMGEHVDKGVERPARELRIIVFTPPDYEGGDANDDGWGTGWDGVPGDTSGGGGGSRFEFEVYAFVRVRVVAWELSSNTGWLLMEFRGWDKDCGPGPK